MAEPSINKKITEGFGTAPVFFTAISTILGAILFLRFGYAVGTLGFTGVLLIILVGHIVTIATALSISEIATNQKVKGGGEYFIISRSFGLNIGSTIGIALYFSQAISVAFYVIAFTEAFEPLFSYLKESHNLALPRQVISIPAMGILSLLILKKGANMGVKVLYFVVAILFLSLICFFAGSTSYSGESDINLFTNSFRNFDNFYLVFAIVFPAFTGMTAGVGLSGDLKNPGKSIPLGTIAATVIGMILYIFIAWKLAVSASADSLTNNQLIMSNIALFGWLIIPLGLAASTISSALGSIMVAPRTLQALANDKIFPSKRINSKLSKGKGENNEPYNASIITCVIAFVFVAAGDVNAVAEIISMFFMVTYGSLCLISFLHHFSADPSYRPSFRSKWLLSLTGFVFCFLLMFKINTTYAISAIIVMTLIYIGISRFHKDRKGLQDLFQGSIFQLNRRLHIFLQKSKKPKTRQNWRPSAICISKDTFERENAFRLLNWISFRYGFGTYIHLIEGYFSQKTFVKANDILDTLVEKHSENTDNVYVDTIISPSYTSAVAQVIQLPGVSGMENNMVLFEFDKSNPENLEQITENISLIQAGNFDVCVLGSSNKMLKKRKKAIHIWIRSSDYENANLMILMSYIILGHPDWKNGTIKIFDICKEEEIIETKENLEKLVQEGRLPISSKNIEIISLNVNINIRSIINERSSEADLTLIGFISKEHKHTGTEMFKGYDNIGDVLFIDSNDQKKIQ